MNNHKCRPLFILLFTVTVVLIFYALIKGMLPTKIVYPGGSVEFAERQINDLITLRVSIIGVNSLPVEGANVWLSVGGEPKIVKGGYEFDIPSSKIPLNRKFDVYAEQSNTTLKGHQEIIVNNTRYLAATVQLMDDSPAYVKGTVSDIASIPIAGATVYIHGGPGSATTDAQGNFTIPAKTTEGGEVRLRICKAGYQTVLQDHSVGDNIAYIILKRK